MLFRGYHFCLFYVLAFVATIVLLAVVSVLGIASNAAVVLVLPLLIAAMIEGQAFARRYRCRPSNHLCWIATLRMTAMVVLIYLCIIIPRVMSDPSRFGDFAHLDGMSRALAIMMMAGIAWCLLRVGYSIGLATELKGQQFSDK
ncbi:ABZJ_00895 family protein [Roseobacter weihaiensis]|uniref:ABZJ_00895 family protein n=1 Tax=Roseobacter weihaiensis TaxID=2763262 RepID=UPI001D0B03C3|nr:ABZJ_00895 family protein [Roseobacter sp. H9]